MRRSKNRLLFAFLATLLLATAFARPAMADGQAKVTLVVTGDIYKMNEDKGRGGYPRLAAAIKAERGAHENTIVVHTGDALSPCLLCGFDLGRHVIDIYNRIGFDIFVPGNHEFDFGRDTYLKRMGEAKFPILAANLRGPDGQIIAGHADTRMMTIGDVKIGIVGATAEDSYRKSNPEDLKITPVVPAVTAKARELRTAGADIVLAVTHSPRDIDFQIYDSRIVEVLASGDDHDLRMLYDGRSVMVEAGQDAIHTVAVDLTIDVKTTDGVRAVSWRPHFRLLDSADYAPDPDMLQVVKGYEAELSRELDVPLATLVSPLDSRNATVRGGAAAIANLITDGARAATKAEIAVMNGGGIRGGKQYAPGYQLTRRDVITELPFGNLNIVFEMKGADIRRMAEIGVAKSPVPAGSFMHYSGMTVEADLSKPPGSRVTAIKVNGEPLSDTRTYTVAGSDFLQRGGDGYVMFKTAKLGMRLEDAQLLANDVMVYARQLGSIDIKPESRVILKP